MMTMVDLQTLAKALRTMSKKSQTANGADMLQAVAAWLEGTDVFSPPAELWEHADRLCGRNDVHVKTCPACKGAIIEVENSHSLCGCGIKSGSFMDFISQPFDAMGTLSGVRP